MSMKNKLSEGSNLLWESSRMILPEHRELIQQSYEELNDVKKPILAEDKLEEIERIIIEAMELKQEVEITYFKRKRIINYKGIIIRPLDNKRIELEVSDGIEFLNFDDILDAEVL